LRVAPEVGGSGSQCRGVATDLTKPPHVQRLNRTTAIDARMGFGLDDRADDWFTGIGISFLF